MKLAGPLFLAYLCCCLRVATRPCKYFQLNARYFNREQGIFSKMDIDRLIPPQWRLAQGYDDGVSAPQRYPVFVKPEWSQNARGVHRADNADDLRRIRGKIRGLQAGTRAGTAGTGAPVRYLIQQGATEANEYEIFSIPHHRDPARYGVLTVTQACNDREPNPVNSIYTENTRYRELTGSFSAAQRGRIWALVRNLGASDGRGESDGSGESGDPGGFGISRVSLRADSTDALLRGNFHIIEINLFLPMPINLLDARYSWRDTLAFIGTCMLRLALVTKHRDRRQPARPVFIKSMLYNRRGPLFNWLN